MVFDLGGKVSCQLNNICVDQSGEIFNFLIFYFNTAFFSISPPL
jgi:hypothetical protein